MSNEVEVIVSDHVGEAHIEDADASKSVEIESPQDFATVHVADEDVTSEQEYILDDLEFELVNPTGIPEIIQLDGDSEIVVVGLAERGLKGDKGDKGDKGEKGDSATAAEGAYELETVDVVVQNLANTSSSLPNIPRPNSLEVFLNGLLERDESVLISGNMVNFANLELGVGDRLTFKYMYGA